MKETELRLRELEEFLLSTEVRSSPEAVSSLLASSFVEFGCSGRVYDRSQTLSALSHESPAHWHISNYRVTFLAPDVALAMFRAIKQTDGTKEKVESLRSSIWQKFDGEWKLLFHQGTLLADTR